MKAIITGGQGTLAQTVKSLWNGEILAPNRQELDVSNSQSITDYFSLKTNIDCLICNAGITKDASILQMKVSDWDSVLEINLNGAFRCAKACSEIMQNQHSGHIIFLSSYSALQPHIGQSNYSAAKSGLIGLTKSMAEELGPYNIRVNCVLPGFIESKMTANLKESKRSIIKKQHTLSRFNQAEQVAKFLNFLHSELPHTSGQIFNLDSRIIPHV